MIQIKTVLGAKMTLDESVINWKKDDFNARYGVRDEKGNLQHNPDHIYKEVQKVKEERKAKANAEKAAETAKKEAKEKSAKRAEQVYEAHKKANKTDKPSTSDKPKEQK